jgi:hypothetical protein
VAASGDVPLAAALRCGGFIHVLGPARVRLSNKLAARPVAPDRWRSTAHA